MSKLQIDSAVSCLLKAMVILAFASNGFAATAVFTGPDTTTEGNWKGTYGADGSNVIGGTASYPAYATVTRLVMLHMCGRAIRRTPELSKRLPVRAASRGRGIRRVRSISTSI